MLLCFDMDDTLVHADEMHVEAFNNSFAKNGLPGVSAKKLKKHFGKIGKLIVKTLFPELDDKKVMKIVKDHNWFLINKAVRHVRAVKGADSALKKLKEAGYKMALLSNCTHGEIEVILSRAGIDKKLFDVVIGSDEVSKPKPWPDEILKAKSLLKAKSCYMIGDTTYDVETGKKVGAKTVAVLTGNHSRAMLIKAKPDHILKSVADLPGLLNVSGGCR